MEEGLGNLENGRISNIYFQKWKMIESACFVFSVLTLGLSILEYEIEFLDANDTIQKALLWLVFICTGVLVAITVLRYRALLEYQKSRNLINKSETIFSSGLHKSMIIEMILTLPHPSPFFIGLTFDMTASYTTDVYYHTVNEILNVFQIARIIIILRVLMIYSYYFNSSSQRVCGMYAVEPNYFFVIKSLMRSKPFTVVSLMFGGSILIFAYALRICERPMVRAVNNYGLASFPNAMWNVVVTMTTVGYGDYYPMTSLGRIVAFFICIWGVFVVSLMVVTLSNFLNMSTPEMKAFNVIERIQIKNDLKQLASKVIKQLVIMRRKSRNGETLTVMDAADLRRCMDEFKLVNRAYKSITDEGTSLSEEMTRQFEFLKTEIKDIHREPVSYTHLTLPTIYSV
eukprot:TRINITY_DN4758_c0_g1_i6.p1 TRINITY_DN4758_c0_g1~~TRINITY_DN4758_c0_g1_i6.p1  ORF type:complete len:400 (+),score=64.40 TRINITY_DN4758_c0_g1_i6:224-1423(+)